MSVATFVMTEAALAASFSAALPFMLFQPVLILVPAVVVVPAFVFSARHILMDSGQLRSIQHRETNGEWQLLECMHSILQSDFCRTLRLGFYKDMCNVVIRLRRFMGRQESGMKAVSLATV